MPTTSSRIIIDDQPHAIVGVLAPTFSAPFLDAQIVTPLVASAEPQPRSPPRTVVGLAELASGASIAQARDELATMSRQLAQEFPRTHGGWTLGMEPARTWQYGSMRATLLMLLSATAFVLLFLMIKENATKDGRATPASITVAQNWFEELKRLVPAK